MARHHKARDKTMIRHNFEEQLLQPCRDLMRPVHVDFMPPSYPMPSASNCSAGHDPWYVYPFYKEGADPKKVLGANERMYSQCKRIQIAYDYVTEVFEPREGVRYDAFIRARPDGVFLRPVPSMSLGNLATSVSVSSFDISKLTISSSAPGDHWHLIHRGCLGPFERRCLRCRGKEFDKKCPKPTKVYDVRVQEVIAREHPAEVIRSQSAAVALPQRSAANEAFGYLWLECDRWEKVLSLGLEASFDRAVEETQNDVYTRFLLTRAEVNNSRAQQGPSHPPPLTLTGSSDIERVFHQRSDVLCRIRLVKTDLKVEPTKSCLNNGRVQAFWIALRIFQYRLLLPKNLDLLLTHKDFLMEDFGVFRCQLGA
eukprot:s1346_g14.t2